MSSRLFEDYNVPFTGISGNDLARDRLRFLKRELRENPGVNKRYIQAGVREFLSPMRKIIDRIPQGTNLIVMPSTTKVNRIPFMLAREIKKLRPDLQVVNSKERLIKVNHVTESKIKDQFIDRLSDHRSFLINDAILKHQEQLNRGTLIIDDSISTGDSAITLHRQLLQRGIYARGIVAAVAGTKYHMRVSDVDRLYKKIKDHRPAGYSEENLKLDMYNTFVGYPDAKIKRVELGLMRKGQIYERPDLLVHYIRSTSAYLKRERLGPSDMLEAKQRILPDLSKQQERGKSKSKGPSL